jgi:hypothetical protein
MTDVFFYKCLKELVENLNDDWDYGNEVNDEVVEIIKLCKRYLEEKEKNRRK